MPETANRLGLTNHVMGCVPQHPYFVMLIASLESYNHNWIMPYLTIMNSAGPHFVSMVWESYLRHQSQNEVHKVKRVSDISDRSKPLAAITADITPLPFAPTDPAEVRILGQDEYVGHAWSFFTKTEGGTWHQWSWDTVVFKWVGNHILVFVGMVFCGLVGVVAGAWVAFARGIEWMRRGAGTGGEEMFRISDRRYGYGDGVWTKDGRIDNHERPGYAGGEKGD